jgi:hypothetical protein
MRFLLLFGYFAWITGVVTPVVFFTLVDHDFPMIDSATATGLLALAATEVAIRLLSRRDDGGPDGSPSAPVTA